jgi:endonuclease/exonuclease/phosphatase family metal-dependent hydrolase
LTCAEDYNYWYRQRQVKELVKFVSKSDADFVLLGGDFNVDPKVNANETTYQDVKNIMTNSIEEFFHKIEDWLTPKKASYANPSNTYSNKFKPVLYDYIFHRAKGKNIILTNLFKIPFLKTWISLGQNGTDKVTQKEVSLSDHEAVTAELWLWK